MALVRATQLGVGPHGGKIKPGDVFEHAGPLASWMELVGGQPSPAPSKVEAEKPAPAVEAETTEPEAAGEEPAGSKRQLRGRKKEAE